MHHDVASDNHHQARQQACSEYVPPICPHPNVTPNVTPTCPGGWQRLRRHLPRQVRHQQLPHRGGRGPHACLGICDVGVACGCILVQGLVGAPAGSGLGFYGAGWLLGFCLLSLGCVVFAVLFLQLRTFAAAVLLSSRSCWCLWVKQCCSVVGGRIGCPRCQSSCQVTPFFRPYHALDHPFHSHLLSLPPPPKNTQTSQTLQIPQLGTPSADSSAGPLSLHPPTHTHKHLLG